MEGGTGLALLAACLHSINQSIKTQDQLRQNGHSGPSSTRPLLMNRSQTSPCRPTIWIPLVQVNHLGHIKHCHIAVEARSNGVHTKRAITCLHALCPLPFRLTHLAPLRTSPERVPFLPSHSRTVASLLKVGEALL